MRVPPASSQHHTSFAHRSPPTSLLLFCTTGLQIRGHASDRRAEGKRDTEGGGWDKRRKGKDKRYREGTRTKDSEREELVMHGVAGGGSRIRASEHRGIKERSKERRARPVGGSTGVNASRRRRTCVRFVERGGVEGGERGDEEAAKEEEGAGGGRK